jgi:hypothetical protein
MENVKVRALQRAGLEPSPPKSPISTNKKSSIKNEESASAFEEIKRATSTATSGTFSPSAQSTTSDVSIPSPEKTDTVMLTLPLSGASQESSQPVVETLSEPAAKKPLPSSLISEAVEVPQEKKPEKGPVAKKPPPQLSVMSSLESVLDDLSDDQVLSPLKEIPLSQQKASTSVLQRKNSSNANDSQPSKIPLATPTATSTLTSKTMAMMPTVSETKPLVEPLPLAQRSELMKGQSLMSFDSRQNSLSGTEADVERDLTAQDLFSRMGSLKQKIMQTSSRNFSSFDAGETEGSRSRSGSQTSGNVPTATSIPNTKGLNALISREEENDSLSSSGGPESHSIATNTTQLSALERLKLKVQQSKLAKG